VCIWEIKLSVLDDRLILELLGSGFGYDFVLASETRGGILVAWKLMVWAGSHVRKEAHCLTVKLSSAVCPALQWWLSVVYGPHRDQDKRLFLSELQQLRSLHLGPWLVCEDFNLIYRTTDKNNSRLNRSLMLPFCNALNSMELTELHL
jgi:hypothetical protein